MLNPEISYIIVSHNSEKFISNCINSILQQTYDNKEIIVVDNRSDDKTLSILNGFDIKENKITIISNYDNLGYGKAVMQGAKISNGKFLAILNADTILDRKWTSELIERFESDKKLASLSGKILFPDGDIQSLGGLMDKYGAVIQKGSKIFMERKLDESSSVFYNDGSALMIRRNIFEKIGFDPNLFLYYEDVDLAWRIQMSGYKIGIVSTAISYHDIGHSKSIINPWKFYQISRNRMYVCQKNYSLKKIISRVPGMVLLIFFNAVYYDFKRNEKGYINNFFKAVFWNLQNFNVLLNERKKIKKIKKVPEYEIERSFVNKSIEWSFLVHGQ